jgi:hypothetical protein
VEIANVAHRIIGMFSSMFPGAEER